MSCSKHSCCDSVVQNRQHYVSSHCHDHHFGQLFKHFAARQAARGFGGREYDDQQHQDKDKPSVLVTSLEVSPFVYLIERRKTILGNHAKIENWVQHAYKRRVTDKCAGVSGSGAAAKPEQKITRLCYPQILHPQLLALFAEQTAACNHQGCFRCLTC